MYVKFQALRAILSSASRMFIVVVGVVVIVVVVVVVSLLAFSFGFSSVTEEREGRHIVCISCDEFLT